MKVKVNIRDHIEENADHNDMLLVHASVDVDELFDTNPEPSVIYSPEGEISQKNLENPAGFWNNVGRNRSSLFQNKGAFE